MNTLQQAHPIDVETALKRHEAVELRRGHATYRQIAERLGVTVGYAYKLVIDALEDTRMHTAENAQQLRELELQRLDDMALKLSSRMSKAGDEVSNRDIETILRIQERRSRLLGLDAPTEHSGPGGGPIPITAVDAREALKARIDNIKRQLEAGKSEEEIVAAVKTETATNGEHP